MLLLILSALAAPSPREQALDALADGDPGRAVTLLEGALRQKEDTELRCLYGRALRAAGRLDAAARALDSVPADASCGRQARFDRADALLGLNQGADAARIYADLAGPALAGGRDTWLAGRLSELASQVQADPDADPSLALLLLQMALELDLPAEQQLQIARTLAPLTIAQYYPPHAGLARLGRSATEADRALYAPLLPLRTGFALIGALTTPERLRAAAEAALHQGEPSIALTLLARLPDQAARYRAMLADAGWAPPATLPVATDPEAAAVSRTFIERFARTNQYGPGIVLAEDYLRRFPTGSDRAWVETTMDQMLLSLGRQAVADGRFDDALSAFDRSRDPEASYEAALAARAAGDRAGAKRRMQEGMARHAGTNVGERFLYAYVRLWGFDEGESAAALSWLKREANLGNGAAAIELDRWTTPALAVRTEGGAVTVQTRNLKEIQVRLHRIDADALLRTGGGPEHLPDLDVAIIAADRSWTVPVPDYLDHQDRTFSLPIDKLSPGYYAITVASRDQEATAILLRSDLQLLSRVVDGQAVTAVLRGGQPVSGASVRLWSGGAVTEGKTDSRGLYTAEHQGGRLVVMAEHKGAPVMLAFDGVQASSAAAEPGFLVHLDRPIHRPGDRVGFVVTGRRATEPYHVSLSAGGVELPAIEVRPDAAGMLVGELSLPDVPLQQPELTLYGSPVDEEGPTFSATIRVAPTQYGARRLTATMEDGTGLIRVREPDGTPAADVPVRWALRGWDQEGLARTDAAGVVRVPLPDSPLDMWLDAHIAGTDTSISVTRPLPPPDQQAELDGREAQVGGAFQLRLLQDGPVEIRLHRTFPEDVPVATPDDPWTPSLPLFLTGPTVWSGTAPPAPAVGMEEPVWSTTAERAGVVTVPAAAEGDYLLRVIPLDGRPSQIFPVQVGAPLRLEGLPSALSLGQSATISVSAPALLTIEGGELLASTLVRPGQPFRWTVPSTAHGTIQVTALGLDGRVVSRSVSVDASLQVGVAVETVGATWRVRATVKDGTGKPVAARVLLRAIDEDLISSVGPVPTPLGLIRKAPTNQAAGYAATLRHGTAGHAVDSALLDERQRDEEAKVAEELAQSGAFQSNAFMEQLAGDELVMPSPSVALGGLGTSGSGYGGGGMGRGYAQRQASWVQYTPWGERERVLWSVVETGSSGVAEVVVPTPTRPTQWKVEAIAFAAENVGAGEAEVDTSRQLGLLVAAPRPGRPGEVAAPVVRLWNGADTAYTGTLTVGDRSVPIQLAPGAATTVTLDPQPAGSSLPVAVEGTTTTATWSFPLQPGAASADTAVVMVGGGVDWLARLEDPASTNSFGRAAAQGRAALAALSVSAAPEALLQQVHAARAALRLLNPDDASDVAEGVLFLSEARALLGIPEGEITTLADSVDDFTLRPDERVRVAHARAAAGQTVDDATLARLSREALSPEDEAELLRTLHLLGYPVDRQPQGDGPQAALARLELGLAKEDEVRASIRRTPAPLPGAAGRPEWIRVAAGPDKGATVVIGQSVTVPAGQVRTLTVPANTTWTGDAVVLRGEVQPTGEYSFYASRYGKSIDGSPLSAQVQSIPCANPCALAPGEVLSLSLADLAPGWSPPAGLRPVWSGYQLNLYAEVPGTYLLSGLDMGEGWATPLTLQVGEASMTALGPDIALQLATEAAAADLDPLPMLASWTEADWPPELLPQVAALAFHQGGDAATRVARFETLRDTDPGASLSFAEVAEVAAAYAAIGRPERAVAVWRAGLGAAFLSDAAIARQLEDVLGPVMSLRTLRSLTARYPAINAVEEALFQVPERLGELADTDLNLPGVTPTDLRLTAAAWDREFLALYPASPRAPEAGFRLLNVLFALDAPGQVVSRARTLARQHPDSALLDSFLYLEGLAQMELGADSAALALFERLATGEFPLSDGSQGPALSRPDARYAAARLVEARGDLARARALYEEVDHPEVNRTLANLSRVSLSAPPLVMATGAAVLPLTTTNVDQVEIRAYRLDLRTLFLRDGSLADVRSVNVAGLSPDWSGARPVRTGPWPTEVALSLPLSGSGAWLVQVFGDGIDTSALIVRSELALDSYEIAGVRRITVRNGNQPAAGVEVRAVTGDGQRLALQTDRRGVVEVPSGAPVLVFDGDDYAFTDPEEANTSYRYDPVYEESMDNLRGRLDEQRARNADAYETNLSRSRVMEIEASKL